jgi:hypothetical protein
MIRPWALTTCLLLAAGCARTALNADCPNGYTFDGDKCICSTDEGCPTGFSCEEGVCQCRSSGCCPLGYEYSSLSEACVCRASECCPKDHRWIEAERKCTCAAQNCCPDGYTFNETSKSCECAADQCCPKGFVYDASPMKQACVCNSDSCCPVDFVYDAQKKDCVCARDACCPPNHKYSANVRACVCIGDSCCPTGYKKDVDQERCVCLSNAACGGVNNFCDNMGPDATGSCKCLNDLGCPTVAPAPPQFCNSLGFCQSIAACTSNGDCPMGYFCDISNNRCILDGPCTLDDHCAFDSICNASTAACKPGCRRDGDCNPKKACVNQTCTNFCRDSSACPVNQFCNTTNGTCAPTPSRVDCNTCTGAPLDCGGSSGGATCLTFISEGQTKSFCGVTCKEQADCPSGFDCGAVIFGCSGGFGCTPVAGQTISCKAFQVENETGDQFFCADGTGQPHEYFRSCAPSSGICPATAAP